MECDTASNLVTFCNLTVNVRPWCGTISVHVSRQVIFITDECEFWPASSHHYGLVLLYKWYWVSGKWLG